MLQPRFLHSDNVHSKGLSDISLRNFSNRLKRRQEADIVKAHSPPAQDTELSKAAKWKHKNYQRIANTQAHADQLHRSKAEPAGGSCSTQAQEKLNQMKSAN